MRVGNVQFAKGSVVFADFPPKSEQAYLNGRPLVVVSHPIYIFGQVVVCPIGSKMKPGIQVKLWNYWESRPIGNHEVGTIYPYNLISIKTETISRQIGILDHFIMEEVDRAISFFLGLNNDPPEFMKSMEEAYEVNYTYMTKAFTCDQRVGDEYMEHATPYIQKPIQKELDESENSCEDASEEKPTSTTISTTPTPTATESVDEQESPESAVGQKSLVSHRSINQFYMRKFVDKYFRINPEAMTFSAAITSLYNRVYEKCGWDQINASGFGRSFSNFISKNYPNVTLIRGGSRTIVAYRGLEMLSDETDEPDKPVVEPVAEVETTKPVIIELPSDADELTRQFAYSKIVVNPSSILPYNHDNVVKYISLRSMAMIISRRVPIEAVAIKYSLSMDQALELRSSILKHVIDEVNHFLATEKNLNKFTKYNYNYKLGLAILLEFGKYVPNSAKVRVQLNQMTLATRNEYKVNFADPIWNDLRTGK